MTKVRYPDENDKLNYFTQRSLYIRGDKRKKNWGSTDHKIKVWVFKEEPDVANVEYQCPNCDHKGAKQMEWVRPLIFLCDNKDCGKKIKVPKLK